MPEISDKINQKIACPQFRVRDCYIEKEDPQRIETIELFSPDSDKEAKRSILAIILAKQLSDALDEESRNYQHAQLFGSPKKIYCANIVQVNDVMNGDGNGKVRFIYIDKVYDEDKDSWYQFDDYIQLELMSAEMPFIMDIRVDSFKKHQMKITKKDGKLAQRCSTVGKFISKSIMLKNIMLNLSAGQWWVNSGHKG